MEPNSLLELKTSIWESWRQFEFSGQSSDGEIKAHRERKL